MSGSRGTKSGSLPRLIIDDSESSADLLYATGFFAPDPFLFLEKGGRVTLLLSDLEIDRGRALAKADEVEAYSVYETMVQEKAGVLRRPAYHTVVLAFLRKHRVKRAMVPERFPLGLARQLEAGGVALHVVEGHFWPERERKKEEELRALRRALKGTAEALRRGFGVLREAKVGRGRLLRWRGRVLTSEILRAEIEMACIGAGLQPSHTIVAGGEQGCDPHERGSGPLKGGELIILDCFPRDTRSGYFGDLTRTVVKGAANDAQRRLWETVRAGQRLAFRRMQPGVLGGEVHEEVQCFFAERGYRTGQEAGRHVGFFHGTGHGLGLELHEAPRFGATRFCAGQVFTVEPGLYYPGLGGVRTEDVAVVTEGGARWLSRLEDPLEIE